jgi:hypothetical protein
MNIAKGHSVFMDATRTQGETIPYKKLHMKLKIEQHELTEDRG